MDEAPIRRRKPLQERSRLTYDHLLDAAGAVLSAEGIERLSAALVCARAKVTAPAFYRYFDDKYALMEALAERLMALQNLALNEWVETYRSSGLQVLSDRTIDLMRTMALVTDSQPGAMWIMRAMHAVPSLAPIRLASHNYVADVLTDVFHVYLPHVDRVLLRRRLRLAVEIAYSTDEMMKEEDLDRDQTLADAHFVLQSMLNYPEHCLQSY